MDSADRPMPQVTWLISVKNGMPYLTDTLASIAAQTFTDYEVLVWMVEGYDHTEEELNRWIPARLPGEIYRSGPFSMGAARAELVKRARGEFCAVIDADDLNQPERLARQVSFLRAHPEIALVGSQLRVIDEASQPTGRTIAYPLAHDDIVHGFISHNTIGQPSVLCRRAALLAAGNYDPAAVIEDYDMWLRLASAHRLANLPECLVDYRMFPQSNTRLLEKAGLAQQQIDQTFANNARSLFGLSPATALRVRQRRSRALWIHAWTMAHALSRSQNDDVHKHLRSTSFVHALGGLTSRWDFPSTLLLGALDPTPDSFLQACKNIRRKFRRVLPLKTARKLNSYLSRRRWIHSLNKTGCHVDPRIELAGRTDALAHLHIQQEVIIEKEVTIWSSPDPAADPRLRLDKRVFIGRNTYIGVHAPISIGSNTIIGAYSYLISGNHRFESRDAPMRDQGFAGAPIQIGEDVWIGTHVVILPGVTIAKGAIIAAGGIVSRNVGAYEIWGGVPARLIKMRP